MVGDKRPMRIEGKDLGELKGVVGTVDRVEVRPLEESENAKGL